MADLAGQKKATLSELSQQIDLKEFLGRKPTDSEKSNFSELAIERINQRTLDGEDVGGSTFTQYSKEYADLKGVSRSSVDLFLEGDMLDGIGRRKSKERANTVFIQMKKGLETKKGYNHDVGDTLPKREFFGITKKEAKDIADQVKEAEPARTRLSDLRRALNAVETLGISINGQS